jgi:hypothetical protein
VAADYRVLMAKGRRTNQLLLLLAIAMCALLMVANVVPNPFPEIWEWLNRERPLAEGLVWQERLGGRAGAATAANDTFAVDAGGEAQLHSRATGAQVAPVGEEEWSSDWIVVAGTGAETVVLINPSGRDGYVVRTSRGSFRHEDEHAVAAWGFDDGWLDLSCEQEACRLRGFRPGYTAPVWETDLPGQRDGLSGANPPLAGPRPPGANRIDSGVSGPGPMPSVLGFPVTRDGGDAVIVVDTDDGEILQDFQLGDTERVIVVGDRVVRSVMTEHADICVSEVTGLDPISGGPVWGPEEFHLWGTEGVGCEQRVAPLAGGGAMTATAPDGRPLVVDAYDGRVLWSGELDQRVEGLTADVAVVRDAEGTTLFGVRLGASQSDGDLLWDRRVDQGAGVTAASCGVVVSDQDPNRLYVWDPASGEDRLSLSTSARAVACAPDGLLIADGRSIGFARFAGADVVPEPADPADPPRTDDPLDYK